MYVTLGQAIPAGCQLPYTVQGNMAYSRAFLERQNSADRYSYQPSASAQKQIEAWRAVGLDPYQPVSLAVAQSKLRCGGIEPLNLQDYERRKTLVDSLARDNAELVAKDATLNQVFRAVFRTASFSDAEIDRLRVALADAARRQSGSVALPVAPLAPVITKPVVMPRLPDDVPKVITPPVPALPPPFAAEAPAVAAVRSQTSITVPMQTSATATVPPAKRTTQAVASALPWLLAGGLALFLLTGKKV